MSEDLDIKALTASSFLLSVVLLVFCSGCGDDSTTIQDMDLTGNPARIDLISDSNYATQSDDLFTNLQIRPLRLPNGAILSGIDKLLPFRGSYFVMDSKFTTVYEFDSLGSFKNKIGGPGVVKGFYRSLEDFEIDSMNRIVILSNEDRSLHFFTTSGRYLKTTRLGFFNSKLAIPSPDKYLIYLNCNANKKSGSNNLVSTDSSGNILKRYRPFDSTKSKVIVPTSGFLAHFGNDYLYSDAYNDTIYSIDPISDKIRLSYYADFGPASVGKLKDDLNRTVKQHLLANRFGYLCNDVCFNDNFISLPYCLNGKYGFAIFNKTNGSIKKVNRRIADGLFKLLDHPLLITNENKCYFVVSSNLVMNLKDNYKELFEKLSTKWPLLYKFLTNYTLDDNYFILSVDLKK